MSYDSRGVLRGPCTGCPCRQYNGGQDLKKCLECGHPPGKHQNLDDPTAFAAPNSHGIGAFHSSPTNTSNHGPGGPSAAAHHQPRDYQPQYMSHRYHQYASQPHLPQCHAPGCSKPVHCDFSLPESLRNFNYCSPQCRDIDLLPAAKTTLTSELEVLKGELQAAAATDVSSNKPQVSKNPSFEHSSSNSGMSNKFSWISLGDSKKKADQMTVQVEGRKEKYKSFGLILSKKLHTSDKALGFIVIGAVKDSQAYSMMQEDSIRIFDVIESVNERSCSDLIVSTRDYQECFDMCLDYQVRVRMCINRSISLPPVSNTLDFACRQALVFTEVIALRYLPIGSGDKHYGLSLTKATDRSITMMVERISKDTPAFYSGLQHGDKIHMYAIASHDTIGDSQLVQTKTLNAILLEIEKAHDAKKSVIFVIQRFGKVTYI